MVWLMIILLGSSIWNSQALAQSSQQGEVAAIARALRAGDYPEALRTSELALKTNPHSSEIWTLRAVALERTNEIEKAIRAYDHALKAAPNYLPALEGAAQVQYRRDPPAAAELLRRVITIQPANATAHAMLGVLEYHKKDFAGCARDFDAASHTAGSISKPTMEHALCLVHADRSAEAVSILQELLAGDPNNSAARYDLALIQWRSGSTADALATLAPSLDPSLRNSAALRLAAAIHEAAGETPAAVELLRSAMLANPDDVDNYLDFATLSFQHGSYSVGIDMVSIGLNRVANSAALHMARGVLYGQNGDFEKAMNDFEQAHQLDPRNSMAASAEGIAQSQQHNHQQALEQFRRQVHEHPNDAFGYYLLAETLSWSSSDNDQSVRQGEMKEAIAAARKAQQLDPKLIQAYELLASLYFQNDDYDAAIKECQAALSLKQDDQPAIYTMMLALRKTGKTEEAKQMVQRLTEARKNEQAANAQNPHYGKLVEVQ